jgi:hypothetical protein
VGNGYGYLLDEARPQGAGRTGAVEPDCHARQRLQTQGHAVYDSLSMAGGGWSMVSFPHVLEHLADPLVFLAEVARVVAADGLIFAEVPNESQIDQAVNDAPHLVFYTGESLGRLFERAGYREVTVFSCGAEVGVVLRILRRVLRRCGAAAGVVPPAWLDRLLHPHFRVAPSWQDKWMRVLARPPVIHQ